MEGPGARVWARKLVRMSAQPLESWRTMMSTTADSGIGETAYSRQRRPHADAGIVFGSAATAPVKKPDSVRATCEAIGLARSTYYYQSHRSASAIEFEQKIVLRLHALRDDHTNDGYRRMTLQLQAEGFHVNRKRIARLMALHSLTKKQSRPGNLAPRFVPPRAPIANLGETARLTGPYQLWSPMLLMGISGVAWSTLRRSLMPGRARSLVCGLAADYQSVGADCPAFSGSGASAGAGVHPPLDVWDTVPHAQLLRAVAAVWARSFSW